NDLHKTKNKITRIFQLLSIKVRNNRRKSNESGDLDRIFCIVDKSVGKKWAKALWYKALSSLLKNILI
ncbi:hypothetical protein KZ380_05425, partial [Glaesserella parasuis]|nr:hypothetical protein [Glaesserella parasuis]